MKQDNPQVHIIDRRQGDKLRAYLVGWFFASLLWQLMRGSQDSEVPLSNEIHLKTFVIFVIIWIVQALVYGAIDILFERYLKLRVSFIKLISFSLVLQGLTTVGVFFLGFHLLVFGGVINASLSLMEFVQLPVIRVGFVYTILVNFSIVFLIQLNYMFGEGNLMKVVSGKFYRPREQDLIFMFLDLKDSTTLAEKLGHIKYSELIQDCFRDMAVTDSYDASIYQYVGDEAVLTWQTDIGLKDNRCLHAFYAFRSQLKQRESHYVSKYGQLPVFKAGMNSGIVTTVEVGEYKKEIAHHGDTINTAARLQGQCNRLGADLIISERLLNSLDLESWAESKFEGEVLLKGKKGVVNMYSIRKIEQRQ